MSSVIWWSVGCPSTQRGSAAWLVLSMAHLLQIGDVRARAELLQHAVGALAGEQLRRAAGRVLEIAEHDRLGRAGLLAGGLDRPVGDRLAGLDARVLPLLDPLHAQAALLHHAA